MPRAKRLHGIDRERRSLAFDFAVVHFEARLVGDGGGEHLAACLGRRGRTVEFVRRNAGGKEDHLVEFESLHGIAGENEVAIVNWIEAAAIEANLFIWFQHGVV